MRGMTKDIFLNAVQCRTLGWFLRSTDASPPPTLADRFRMEQGSRIGRLARELYPDGALVASGATAVAETQRLMADPAVSVLFEATFTSGESTAKADVLLRTGQAWAVIEVKSKLEDTKDMPDLIADLAYTVSLARKSGVRVARASLLLLSRGFRKGMPVARLFTEIDQKAAVNDLAPALDGMWSEIERATASATRPTPVLTKACKACAFFETTCIGAGIQHPVTEIPRLSEPKLLRLSAAGIVDIAGLPAGFALTDAQARVVSAARTRRPFVGSIRAALQAVAWPASYLDFESVQTAIPLYDDLAPYTQIPTQYSIHRCTAPGQVSAHHDFVCDPSRDCQRELAEGLIRDVGTAGSVIVYSSFERTRIRALAERFPDLAPALDAIDSRLFDLCAVISKEYYHPDFHGSTSIKAVLPVIVPALSYEGMEIGDGDAASAVFALIAMGAYPPDEANRLLGLLRAYCAQDSLAMVTLHEALFSL